MSEVELMPGAAVRVRADAPWGAGAVGIVVERPAGLEVIGAGARTVDTVGGPVRLHWVEVLGSVADEDEDGSYLAGEVAEDLLERIDDAGFELADWDGVGELFDGGAELLVTIELAGAGWRRRHVIAARGAEVRCADPAVVGRAARITTAAEDVAAEVLARVDVDAAGALLVTRRATDGAEIAIVTWRPDEGGGRSLVDPADPEDPGRSVTVAELLAEVREAISPA